MDKQEITRAILISITFGSIALMAFGPAPAIFVLSSIFFYQVIVVGV